MNRFRLAPALTALLVATWVAPIGAQRTGAGPTRLVGFVRDSIALAPVSNAEVRVAGTRIATLTDGQGRFDLEPPAGAYVLEIGGLGYASVRLPMSGAPAEPLRIALAPAAIPLAEVVVTPGHFGVAKEVAAPQSMTRDEIQTRPQLGEDIYRAVTRLPGVTSDDFSARFSIRGGSNDQLLTTLDGVELYEPFHLKDLDASLSILDVESIGGVDLVTGGFAADRGDRLTGVFDMRTVDARAEPPRAVVGISLGNARFLSRGGFGDGRGQWLASVRRGYLDILLGLVEAEAGLEPRYWDGLAKIEWDFSPTQRVGVHFLFADDTGKFLPTEDPFDPELRSRYKSRYGWLTWRSAVGDRVAVNTVLTVGGLQWVRDGLQRSSDNAVRFQVVDRRDFDFGGIRQDWTLEHSDRLLTKAGWEWKQVGASYDYLRWERRLVAGAAGTVARFDSVRGGLEPRGHEYSFYAAERFRPIDPITLEIGGRYDRQTRTGDEEWSPRVNVAWQPTSGLSLRAAWGRYAQSQELYQLMVPDGDTTFYPADHAVQRVVGLEQTLGRGASVRLELYDRDVGRTRPRYWNLENDVELFPERVFARRRIEPDRAEARGMELFARSGPGRFTWSAGYTLAQARVHLDTIWVADPIDQRHALYLDLALQPSSAWRLATAWQYHSGWPITEQTAAVTPLGGQRFRVDRSFGPLNTERLPAYHRMDLRVTRDVRVGRGVLSVFADIFNLLNRDNVRGFNWTVNILDQTGRFQVVSWPIELLPRLPSIGASYQF